jgi:hypothetical protein
VKTYRPRIAPGPIVKGSPNWGNPPVLPRTAPQQQHSAALICAGQARDAADLADLLHVCGLDEEVQRWAQ